MTRCPRCFRLQYDLRFEVNACSRLGQPCCCPDRPVWHDAFDVLTEIAATQPAPAIYERQTATRNPSRGG